MAMIDMSIKKKSATEVRADEKQNEERERFPFGLKIHLEKETLEKLGMKDLPKVGDKKKLMAMVEVTDIHESETIGGSDHRSVGLQIISMSLEDAEKKNTEDLLFDKG